jgi:hypothetical protein
VNDVDLMWLVTFAYASETAHAVTVLASSAQGARKRAANLYAPDKGSAYRAVLEAEASPVSDGLIVATRAEH